MDRYSNLIDSSDVMCLEIKHLFLALEACLLLIAYIDISTEHKYRIAPHTYTQT